MCLVRMDYDQLEEWTFRLRQYAILAVGVWWLLALVAWLSLQGKQSNAGFYMVCLVPLSTIWVWKQDQQNGPTSTPVNQVFWTVAPPVIVGGWAINSFSYVKGLTELASFAEPVTTLVALAVVVFGAGAIATYMFFQQQLWNTPKDNWPLETTSDQTEPHSHHPTK